MVAGRAPPSVNRALLRTAVRSCDRTSPCAGSGIRGNAAHPPPPSVSSSVYAWSLAWLPSTHPRSRSRYVRASLKQPQTCGILEYITALVLVGCCPELNNKGTSNGVKTDLIQRPSCCLPSTLEPAKSFQCAYACIYVCMYVLHTSMKSTGHHTAGGRATAALWLPLAGPSTGHHRSSSLDLFRCCCCCCLCC